MFTNKLSRCALALLTAIATIGMLASASPASASADKGIALTMKVTGDVQLKKAGTDRTLPLKFGTVLDDGDKIRTGDDGFAILIFTDDKSQLKLTAKTEVTIEGKRDANSNITKRIAMEVGQVLAKVQQQKGSLQIATPTSVASVMGTEFWVIVFEDGTTQVVTLEGLVQLLNTQSGRVVDVRPGQRGESHPNGDVGQGTPPRDQVPADPDSSFVPPHNIEIQVQDPDGRIRRVIIEYQETH